MKSRWFFIFAGRPGPAGSFARPTDRPASLKAQTMLISQRVSSIYKSIPRGRLVEGCVCTRSRRQLRRRVFFIRPRTPLRPSNQPAGGELLSCQTLFLAAPIGARKQRSLLASESPDGAEIRERIDDATAKSDHSFVRRNANEPGRSCPGSPWNIEKYAGARARGYRSS